MYAIIMVSISDFCHEFQRKSNVPFEVKVSMPSNSRTNYTIQSHTHRHRHFVIHSLISDIDPKMPIICILYWKFLVIVKLLAHLNFLRTVFSLPSLQVFSHLVDFLTVSIKREYRDSRSDLIHIHAHIYSIHACIHWSHIEFNLCKFYSLMKTKKKTSVCAVIYSVFGILKWNEPKKKQINERRRKYHFLSERDFFFQLKLS